MPSLEVLVIGRHVVPGDKNYEARAKIAEMILSRPDQINLTQLADRATLQEMSGIDLATVDGSVGFLKLKPDFVIYIVDDVFNVECFYLFHLAYSYFERNKQQGRILLIKMSDESQEAGLSLVEKTIVWHHPEPAEKLAQFIDQMYQ